MNRLNMTKMQVYTQDIEITLLPLPPAKIIIYKSLPVSRKMHINKEISLCGSFYYTLYSIN